VLNQITMLQYALRLCRAHSMDNRVILVVDDTNIVREGTILVLRYRFNYETEEAANGLIAIEKLELKTFDAILMDCNMPEMDGFECTAKIRELEKLTGTRAIIIGLTASNARDIREECLKAGMDDYIDKSCSSLELNEILMKWLR
jgi:CheY-like chemotaxis protein